MALSKDLDNALKEFLGVLQPDDGNKPYVEAALTKLHHAEANGLGVYEDTAFEILEGLFDLQRQRPKSGEKASAGTVKK